MLLIKKSRILALIMALVMLIGCSAGDGDSYFKIVKNRVNNSGLTELNITGSQSFLVNVQTYDEDERNAWQDYMLGKYGVKIVTSPPYMGYNLDVEAGKIDGIVCLNYITMLLSLIKSGSIEPLDEYLADNKSWNQLPDEYRKTYEIEGHIWAIPEAAAGVSFQGLYSVRTDWLEKVNLDMPTTLSELYEFGKACTKTDMNGDGTIGNDYVLGGTNPILNQAIWQSFGLYFGSAALPISYDPTLGCMANAFFKPEALPALKYLQTLCSEGIVDPSGFSAVKASQGNYGIDASTGVGGAKYGTGFMWAEANYPKLKGRKYDKNKYEDYAYATNIYEVMPLLKSDYPQTYSGYTFNRMYVLTNATKQPKETINLFVDLLMGSKTNFLDCNIGQHYIDVGNNVYKRIYKDADTKRTYPQPSLGGYLTIGKDIYFQYGDEDISHSIQYKKEYNEYEQAFLKKYKNKLVALPMINGPSGETYESVMDLITMEGNNLLDAIKNPNANMESALTTYRKVVLGYGMVDILKESNKTLGLPNNQVIE